MKIGIRGHDLGKGSINTIIDVLKEYNFEAIQLVCYKLLDNITYEENSINLKKALEIGNKLKENNIDVPLIGSYFNPVHSNKEKVQKSINIFKNYIDYASILGSKNVGSETGSKNDDKWTYHPYNQIPETVNETIRIFKELAIYAKNKNINIALEGAYGHVANTPDMLNYIVKEINEPNIKIIVDIYNYLNIDNYTYQIEILKRSIELFKDEIIVFHLKDFYIDNNKMYRCQLGQGLMNYPEILRIIKEEVPNAYLIFEGVQGNEILPSLKYIKGELEK